MQYPDGSRIQMDYDELGRLISYTDALGQQVRYQYDSEGNPSKRTEQQQKAGADAANTVKRFNAKGNSIAYRYDELGRLTTLINLIAETRFDTHQSRYVYNEVGQLTQQIDNPQLPRHKQHHIMMDYDLIGQLTARHSSHYPEIIGQESSKPVRPQYHRVRYDYDEIGQLTSAVNPNSRTTLAYDAGGRLITETLISHLTQDGAYQAREHTLTHDYDALGNRTSTTLPDGKIINQLYYGSGHLYNQSLYNPSTDEHIELRHSERNKRHLEISREQGALSSRYHYDPMGRLTTQQSNRDQHLTIQRDYHYDALGQLTHLSGHSLLEQSNKSTQSFKRNHQYQYDAQGRLTEHKLTDYQNHTGITEVFAFDPASNRVPVKAGDNTDKTTQTDTPKSGHGRPRELIQNGQRIRYTYDSHGRVLYKTIEAINHSDKASRIALQLQYNANNELEKSLRTQYQGNNVIKTQTVYHYDAFGRRIHKHSETRNFTQSKDQLRQTNKTQHQYTHMLWDSNLPIQEYSDTHIYTTIYEQNSFAPIARLAWIRDDIPEPIIKQDNPHIEVKAETKSKIEIYHYHNDQLGTPNELTNDKGEVIWLADYEAWGDTAKVIYNEIKINQLTVSQTHLQPIRFQGQYFDEETGLHYNRFRYYDSDMGMFISRDPIELNGGLNVFAYAPNPTGWVDPLGLAVAVAGGAAMLGESVGATAAAPVAAVVAAGAGGYWLGTKINDGLEANGINIGSNVYDLTHPKEKIKTKDNEIPQVNSRTQEQNKNQCTATISSDAARRLALKTANANFKPNMVLQGSQPIARRGIKGWEQLLYRVPNTNNITDTVSYVILSHHPADMQHKCPHWHVGYPKELKNNTDSFISNAPYLPTTTGAGSWQYRKGGLPAVEHKIEP